VDLVLEAMALARPSPDEVEPRLDPPSAAPPEEICSALGSGRPLTAAVWCSLTPLDRYALAKVVSRGRPERIAAAYDEIVGQSAVSTHLGAGGGARMVDVGEKPATARRAVAASEVTMSPGAFERLARADVAKGDVLGTARVAGILAAKRTPELIPLCHVVQLSKVTVDFELDDQARSVSITAAVEAVDRTGVEMEALVAVSVAALTVYDMLKAIDRGIVIGPTKLLEKSGGRTGDFRR
jgi:cyclic pyranopterin phosphate synthase